MENKDKSAYPLHLKDNNNSSHSDANGLTKREYFAAMAMQGILAQHEPGVYESIATDMTVKSALRLADELLKQLETNRKPSV